jgi:hypothetical protein
LIVRGGMPQALNVARKGAIKSKRLRVNSDAQQAPRS